MREIFIPCHIKKLLFPSKKGLLASLLSLVVAFFCKGQVLENKAHIDSIFLEARNFNPSHNQKDFPLVNFKLTRSKNIFNRPESVLETSCDDTSGRKRYMEDSLIIESYATTSTDDGNILLAGTRQVSYTPYRSIGYIVKCTKYGDTVWVKNIEGSQSNIIAYYNVFELNDHSIMLAGLINVPVPVNSRRDLILTKLSPSGDFVWQKTFVPAFNYPVSNNKEIDIFDLKSTPSGDIYICGDLVSGGFSRYGFAARLTANGNIVWSKGVARQGFIELVGFNIINNELQAYGDAVDNSMIVTSFDLSTGDTIAIKNWQIPVSANSYWKNFRSTGSTKLNNGNTVLFGRCVTDVFSPDPNDIGHAGMLEISPSFNYVDAYRVVNNRPGNTYQTRVNVHASGDASIATLFGTTTNTYLDITKVSNNAVIKDRAIDYGSESVQWVSNFAVLPSNTDFISVSVGPTFQHVGIESVTIQNWDTSGGCMGNDITLSSLEHIQYIPVNVSMDSVINDVMQETLIHNDYLPFADGFTISNSCNQVNICDSLKLSASSNSVCLPGSLNIKVYKNKNCSATVDWIYSSPNISQPVYVNDSTVQISFSGSFAGYIKAQIPGCNALEDSLYIMASSPQPAVNLGPDQTICPSNTVILNAHNGYTSYIWQDGSADSTFIVTTPGLYYVNVTDACSGSFVDSIHITASSPIVFDLGPDRIKCNDEVIQITAPPGFLNYNWSNNYNINTTSGQTVLVSPLTDTAYYVMAEQTPGCFAYDTIRIKVKHSPLISLGSDKQFCIGDSASLDAGSGFVSYSWNNGLNSQQIIVSLAGEYSVVATTVDGCKSMDTIKVLDPFLLPIVTLDKEAAICAGSNKILNAGNFASYQWNTGEISRSINVSGIGMYIVTVTDTHGCKGNDTTSINELYNIPSGFLARDTSICSYEQRALEASHSYSNYLWNTGSFSASIIVTQPGIYWLQVKDDHNCVGRDSIILTLKECMKGFYIPNIFTPNNDTHNDFFKPFLFGHVINYQFYIYNRWGQLVFHTTDLRNGWDGKFGNMDQSSNTFIWICKYQFEGEKFKIEKGSVILVK